MGPAHTHTHTLICENHQYICGNCVSCIEKAKQVHQHVKYDDYHYYDDDDDDDIDDDDDDDEDDDDNNDDRDDGDDDNDDDDDKEALDVNREVSTAQAILVSSVQSSLCHLHRDGRSFAC